MTATQDTYTETLRSGQDAVVQAFEKWTDAAKDVWANAPGTGSAEVDSQQIIDQVFDFAEKMLAGQREFAKSIAGNASSASEAVRQQSESAVGAVRDQAAAATEAVKKAATSQK